MLTSLLLLSANALIVPTTNPDELRFLVIGDWGSTKGKPKDFENQIIVGKSMSKLANLDQSDFVVSLGDNFYGSKNDSDHGVASVNDEKFTYDWENVYDGKRISQIPWYAVLGNHDWFQNPQPQIDYGKINPRWILDDFFYTRTMNVGGKKVAFVFCTLDLIYYGYDGSEESGLAPDNLNVTSVNNNMRNSFKSFGWTPENDTITKHYAWIEKTLAENADSDYLFVVSHYNMALCLKEYKTSLDPLKALFDKYKVSAYMFGHSHTLAYGVRNSTFYLQSGSGGRAEGCGDPALVSGDWNAGITYGFANVKLNATDATVDYYDKDLVKLSTAGFKPRNIVSSPLRSIIKF